MGLFRYYEDLLSLVMQLLTAMTTKEQQALRYIFLELGQAAALVAEVTAALTEGLVGPVHVVLFDPDGAVAAECQMVPPVTVTVVSGGAAGSLQVCASICATPIEILHGGVCMCFVALFPLTHVPCVLSRWLFSKAWSTQ